MKGFLPFVIDTAKICFIALLIVLPIRAFVFQPFLVKGASMEPNFSSGDYLIVDELSYRFRVPERGEVIVLKYPGDPSQKYIKRIIGLPGETVTVQDGKVSVKNNGGTAVLKEEYLPQGLETPGFEEVALGDSEYFVMGDNRPFSSDSRSWGTLPRQDIIGRAVVRILPLQELSAMRAPLYK
ncbi:MAG: signal peptidase I [Candidatus Wildermuthbacteria bacterium]|nr:signal peptidase I [Candidatus Wildermuthbacteria bacterium]